MNANTWLAFNAVKFHPNCLTILLGPILTLQFVFLFVARNTLPVGVYVQGSCSYYIHKTCSSNLFIFFTYSSERWKLLKCSSCFKMTEFNVIMRFPISVHAFLNRSSCWPAHHVKQQWLFLGEYVYGSCLSLVFHPCYIQLLDIVFWLYTCRSLVEFSSMTHSFLHYLVIHPLPQLAKGGTCHERNIKWANRPKLNKDFSYKSNRHVYCN